MSESVIVVYLAVIRSCECANVRGILATDIVSGCLVECVIDVVDLVVVLIVTHTYEIFSMTDGDPKDTERKGEGHYKVPD